MHLCRGYRCRHCVLSVTHIYTQWLFLGANRVGKCDAGVVRPIEAKFDNMRPTSIQYFSITEPVQKPSQHISCLCLALIGTFIPPSGAVLAAPLGECTPSVDVSEECNLQCARNGSGGVCAQRRNLPPPCG